VLTEKKFCDIILVEERKGEITMAKVRNSELVKASFMAQVRAFLEEKGEEVLQVKSGTFSIPWALGEDEGYLNITFSIPKGSRDGEGYDGHAEAQNYELEQRVKLEEKARREAAKAKKIARDAALREKKRKEKEESAE
jgi:hypothetical protein